MGLKNKYIAVIGAGESGVGAALLAQKLGAEVFVSDYGSIKENYKKELEENSISCWLLSIQTVYQYLLDYKS